MLGRAKQLKCEYIQGFAFMEVCPVQLTCSLQNGSFVGFVLLPSLRPFFRVLHVQSFWCVSKLLAGLNLNSSSMFMDKGKVNTLKVSTKGTEKSIRLNRDYVLSLCSPNHSFILQPATPGPVIIFVNTDSSVTYMQTFNSKTHSNQFSVGLEFWKQ